MQSNSAVRWVPFFVAFVVAGSAMAQSTDKEPVAPAKQGGAKASTVKPVATPKSLDFVPSGSVKATAAPGAATPRAAQPAQSTGKEGSNCHSKESDA